MLTELQVSTSLRAWCPGCGHECPYEILTFLYADESGHLCPGCGSVLIVGQNSGARGKVREPCRLVLSGRLEGSELHEKLAGLIEDGEGLELAVDRTGETRTVRLTFPAPGADCATGGDTR